jgi:hypothetical protein
MKLRVRNNLPLDNFEGTHCFAIKMMNKYF